VAVIVDMVMSLPLLCSRCAALRIGLCPNDDPNRPAVAKSALGAVETNATQHDVRNALIAPGYEIRVGPAGWSYPDVRLRVSVARLRAFTKPHIWRNSSTPLRSILRSFAAATRARAISGWSASRPIPDSCHRQTVAEISRMNISVHIGSVQVRSWRARNYADGFRQSWFFETHPDGVWSHGYSLRRGRARCSRRI